MVLARSVRLQLCLEACMHRMQTSHARSSADATRHTHTAVESRPHRGTGPPPVPPAPRTSAEPRAHRSAQSAVTEDRAERVRAHRVLVTLTARQSARHTLNRWLRLRAW